jgi:MSHA biogenesis protein MshK
VFNRPLKNYCARLCGVAPCDPHGRGKCSWPAGAGVALAVARYISQLPVKPVCLGLLLGLCGSVHAALDPTQPPASALTASANAGAPAALRLQSIVRAAGHSQAVINGQSLRVGDTFGGAKLRAIYSRSVVLERQGQQQVLRLVEPIMKPSR